MTGDNPPDSAGDDSGDDTQIDDLAWPLPQWMIAPLALGLAALFWSKFGADMVLVSLLPFAALLAAVTVIDLRELRIPNRLTAPAAVLAVPLLAIASTSDIADLSVVRSVLAGLAMGAIYFTLAIIHPAGMGLGDVKFAPILGAQLGLFGWITVWRGLFLAFLIVGPIAIVLLVLQRAGKKTALPFGPFMAAGAVVALLLL